jgi:hypothetical protein
MSRKSCTKGRLGEQAVAKFARVWLLRSRSWRATAPPGQRDRRYHEAHV